MDNSQKIPIVDFSSIVGEYKNFENTAFNQIALEFGTAMSKVGFAYIVNHGVDMNKVSHIHELSEKFFQLPKSVKQKYRKTNASECFHGYGGPGDQLLNETQKNSVELREFWDSWGFEAHDEKNFPEEIPGYKLAFDDVRSDCNNLAKKLLRCMGKYLNLPDEHFFVNHHRSFDDPTIKTQTQFRTLYYYRMDPNDKTIPENAIRCGEHADWGTITLLFQDMVGGLEVKRADGTWIDAIPIHNSILVNGAQLMELWSAGIFPATPHRVRIVNDERLLNSARQSFIFFINPDGDTEVEPIVPIPPGKPEFAQKGPLNAYDHYTRSISNTDSSSY